MSGQDHDSLTITKTEMKLEYPGSKEALPNTICKSNDVSTFNFHALFLEKYVPRTLRDRKKDDFMALEKGGISAAAYEAKFHVLSRYATQLVTTEEERICLFVKGLKSEVTDFVKKVEGVRRDGKAKVLANKAKSTGNFQGSYSRGSKRPTLAARPIQSIMPASTGKSEADSSDAVITNTILVCDRMANVLFDIEVPGREKLEWEGVYKPKPAKIISSIRARKLVGQGCLAYLSHIRDVEVESPSIESIHVVSEFREVFPTDLHGMPPDRDIDFYINLEPGPLPISIPPYCMAPTELRELKAQIQELLDKVTFFGHVVLREGVMVDPQKIDVVTNWVRPSSVTEVKSFVGLASYYRRFVKNFASIATHLTSLAKKEASLE
ncbi:hypothetical protein MTR67_025630 [Solanum verrucosum]|uniref:Retrotransposon gag domain-containing protein n=1 Tax=Solanum verrucosum TaxID=315347 RepID=A0AAF0TYW4_SOLVR|nr:hypothetical protein MTR67_025630 [Solanum verrucosum]